MKAIIDSTLEFEEKQLTVDSWRRDSVDRVASGLDGVVSIDLGKRSRGLVQKGILRAVGFETLKEKTDAFAALMDGQTHTLLTSTDTQFNNLRVDSFEVEREDYSGTGLCCEFEITFTQLKDS